MSDPAILAELKKLGKQLTTICLSVSDAWADAEPSIVTACFCASVSLSVMGVLMKPGATALQVIPREPSSFATVFVMPIMAAFEAE